MIDSLRVVKTKELRVAIERCEEDVVDRVDSDRMRGWGLRSLADVLEPLGPMERPVFMALVQCVLAERDAPKPQVDLVWTGPHPRASTARDTYVVVRDLFKSAEFEVIVAGYRFDHGEKLLEPLHARAREGVRVAIFLDVDEKARSEGAVEGLVTKAGQAFLNKNWSFGEPFPEMYYYRRAVEPGRYASMHAKCMVVDRQRALVGSANFTSQGQKLNVEVGVRIDDARVAVELAGHWWSGVQEEAFRLIEIPEKAADAPGD